MQKIKTQELIHTARVKQIPEHATGSDKLEGNGKHVRARKSMDSYKSGVCTQDSITIYLYLTKTREVGHGSAVRRAWSCCGEKGKPILGFPLKLFWGKYPAGMASHPKEVKQELVALDACYKGW